jgi:endonuclease/exonuclease/phosphatase family metal-dependent hydrolase
MRRTFHPGRGILAGLVLMLLLGPSVGTNSAPAAPAAGRLHFDGTLSVLTYNVKGLPWPLARGRSAALEKIAAGLLDLRRQGSGPRVVMLQEAFSAEARDIGRAAGYHYSVTGPSASDSNDSAENGEDRHFLAAARWRKGEVGTKLFGSGLLILSDYPIRSIHRLAWPAFACAGFDCMANKGVLMATIEIPGAPSPVDIVTTHLNSQHSSGVPDARSLYAYSRQTALLSDFIRRWHNPAFPLVVGGDFNVHDSRQRRDALLPRVATWCGRQPVGDALHAIAASGLALAADARSVLELGRDWQFFASGARARLSLAGAGILFGPDSKGNAPSDHVGYATTFRLEASGDGHDQPEQNVTRGDVHAGRSGPPARAGQPRMKVSRAS